MILMEIICKPIAFVRNSRAEVVDDNWGEIISQIELSGDMPSEAFDNISGFSHLEVIYYFHKVQAWDIIFSGRPRGNTNYPVMGILAQRKKERPNKIGLCTVELIEHKDRIIFVKKLDAIDGTPVLDIKPVFKEFRPAGSIRQPGWATDLMKNYW